MSTCPPDKWPCQIDLSAGQVTMSDWLVRKFFHLSKNHALINAEPHVSQNKHDNKTISQLFHVAGYYYLLSQNTIAYYYFARVYKNGVLQWVSKNGVLGPGSEFLKTVLGPGSEFLKKRSPVRKMVSQMYASTIKFKKSTWLSSVVPSCRRRPFAPVVHVLDRKLLERLMSPKSQVMFASAFSWIGDFFEFLGFLFFKLWRVWWI